MFTILEVALSILSLRTAWAVQGQRQLQVTSSKGGRTDLTGGQTLLGRTQLLGGKYEFNPKKPVGRGSFGQVYKARNRLTSKAVCLKLFIREENEEGKPQSFWKTDDFALANFDKDKTAQNLANGFKEEIMQECDWARKIQSLSVGDATKEEAKEPEAADRQEEAKKHWMKCLETRTSRNLGDPPRGDDEQNYNEFQDWVFIATDWLGETTLEDFVDRSKNEKYEPSKDIHKLVLEALRAFSLIENKYVHRDVKMQNMMVKWNKYDTKFRLSVIDLGMMAEKGTSCQFTGTLETMAPEIIRFGGLTIAPDMSYFGDNECVNDPSADIFSLGTVFFYLGCHNYLYEQLGISTWVSEATEARKAIDRLDKKTDGVDIRRLNARIKKRMNAVEEEVKKYFTLPQIADMTWEMKETACPSQYDFMEDGGLGTDFLDKFLDFLFKHMLRSEPKERKKASELIDLYKQTFGLVEDYEISETFVEKTFVDKMVGWM